MVAQAQVLERLIVAALQLIIGSLGQSENESSSTVRVLECAAKAID